jgi:hypothetical protein
MQEATEDLRQMVEDEQSEEEVAREAENLISTRVESVLFEADRHLKDELNKKWKRFFLGTLKAVGLYAGGYLKLDLTKEAFTEVLGAVAEALLGQGHQRPPTATAQFVLEIRHYYAEKYHY